MHFGQLLAILPSSARRSLTDWLNSLPKADCDRETMRATHNLRRIINHLKS